MSVRNVVVHLSAWTLYLSSLLLSALIGFFGARGVCVEVWGPQVLNTAFANPPDHTHPAFWVALLVWVPAVIVGAIGSVFTFVIPLYAYFDLPLSKPGTGDRWLFSSYLRMLQRVYERTWPDSEPAEEGSASAPDKQVEVASRLWRRRYRVDDAGVSELRWDGTPRHFMAWDRLSQVRPSSLRSTFGESIKLRLDEDKKQCLVNAVLAKWRVRCPEAWREDHDRRFRVCRRTIFLYIPLMMFVPWLLLYALPWLDNRRGPNPVEWAKLRGLGIMALLVCGLAWFYYFKWARRAYAEA